MIKIYLSIFTIFILLTASICNSDEAFDVENIFVELEPGNWSIISQTVAHNLNQPLKVTRTKCIRNPKLNPLIRFVNNKKCEVISANKDIVNGTETLKWEILCPSENGKMVNMKSTFISNKNKYEAEYLATVDIGGENKEGKITYKAVRTGKCLKEEEEDIEDRKDELREEEENN